MRQPYDIDLSTDQWQLIEPHLPEAKPGGRPRTTDLRDVLNAIFIPNACGLRLASPAPDFPPATVYSYLRSWEVVSGQSW